MNQWNLEISEEVRLAIEKALLRQPYLRKLVERRLETLSLFAPDRWLQVRRQGNRATFITEPGQRIRLSGLVNFKTKKVYLTWFAFRP